MGRIVWWISHQGGQRQLLGIRGGCGHSPLGNLKGYSRAVSVFVQNGDEWTHQALLDSPNPGNDDGFADSLALPGDNLAVSGELEFTAAHFSGTVCLFVQNGDEWTQRARLETSHPNSYGHFGAALALAADTLVVGAHVENGIANDVGGNSTEDSLP